MTRQTSRLTSLLQPPVPTNGYWGVQQQTPTRIAPNSANSGVVIATANNSWSTLADASSSTPGVVISSSLAGSYTGYEKSTSKGTSVWAIYQLFLEYDTSFIGASRTITSATFKIFSDGYTGLPNSTPTYELYSFDYTATLSDSSYRNKTWLNSNQSAKVATAPMSIFTTTPIVGLKTFNDLGLAASINKTGLTRFVLSNDFHRTNTSDLSDFLSLILLKKNYCYLEVTYA